MILLNPRTTSGYPLSEGTDEHSQPRDCEHCSQNDEKYGPHPGVEQIQEGILVLDEDKFVQLTEAEPLWNCDVGQVAWRWNMMSPVLRCLYYIMTCTDTRIIKLFSLQ